MLKDYSNLVLFLTAFQSGLFALFLLALRRERGKGNLVLGIYLLSLFLQLLHSLYFRYELYEWLPHLAYQGTKLIYLGGPLLYFYTRTRCGKAAFSKKDLLHLLPAGALSLFIFFSFDIMSGAEKLEVLHNKTSLIDPVSSALLLYGYYLQQIIYIVASLRLVKKTVGVDLAWLRFVLYGFVVVWLFDVAMVALKVFAAELAVQYYPLLEAVSRTYTFAYINIFVFKGLMKPELFHGEEEVTLAAKYEKSPLTEFEKVQMLQHLREYMMSQKPHLSPELTVTQLAKKLDVAPKSLSQVINEKVGQNFYDFVNGYRIEEAKSKLINPPDEKITVLEVLYDVGFNSKSSFNTAFKKATGMTPSQFRSLSLE